MRNGAQNAVKQLARQKGVSEKQIVVEIEAAIAEGLRISTQSGNMAALNLWSQIPRKGEVPTAEEFITYCSDVLRTLDI